MYQYRWVFEGIKYSNNFREQLFFAEQPFWITSALSAVLCVVRAYCSRKTKFPPLSVSVVKLKLICICECDSLSKCIYHVPFKLIRKLPPTVSYASVHWHAENNPFAVCNAVDRAEQKRIPSHLMRLQLIYFMRVQHNCIIVKYSVRYSLKLSHCERTPLAFYTKKCCKFCCAAI